MSPKGAAILILGSSHYILWMTYPDREFSSIREGKKIKIKFLGQLGSKERKIKQEKMTDFQ